MIQLGMHTDNWRTLSGSFEMAAESAVKYGLEHIEFAVVHGQNFIQAMGYDPAISLQSNPRALRRYCEKMGLEISQIDGSYPMMGPDGSAFGVQYVQQSIRFAAELGCPMVDTVDGAFEIEGFSREDVFRITCDNYRQVLPWAEDYNVIINIEPHGPYTTDGDFMQRLFDYFDSEPRWSTSNGSASTLPTPISRTLAKASRRPSAARRPASQPAKSPSAAASTRSTSRVASSI